MELQDLNNLTFEQIDSLSDEQKKELFNQIPEEEKETMRQKKDYLIQALPIVLIAKRKQDLHSIAMLSKVSDDYCEKFNCTPLNFIKEMAVVHHMVMTKMSEVVNKDFHRKKKKDKKGTINSDDRIKKEPAPKPYTLGDVMKEKGIIKKDE